ncbi:uncharacterized protein F54H12.2-like [Paramuricea clavata]|uniref:Uncharacterized protein F54H12.2-like n=1 Tax=Paramuricea clavata TaxID=317549 RepID=A0A6S7HBV1_PARCT|nr:uncharacterized protein F54H12.2-like [Paramuricea clavata]
MTGKGRKKSIKGAAPTKTPIPGPTKKQLTFVQSGMALETMHKDSCMCSKSELDLFSVPPTQVVKEKGFWEDVDPITSISSSDTIEFLCAANSGVYTDLASSYLYVKAKITTAAGGKVGADFQVGPSNLWMHALFSQVEVFLNNKLVTPSNTAYSYRAYIETILNFSKDAKDSHLTSALLYKDKAGKMDAVNPLAQDAHVNTGFKQRHAYTRESKSVAMEGRLHSDLFAQYCYILGAVPIKIKLVRSRDPFCLVSSAEDPNFKVVIEECLFRVRRVNVAPSIILAHSQSLQQITAKYPVNRIDCKVVSVPRGNMSGNQPNIFQGGLPNRIVISMVDADAFNGTYTKNAFNFKNYDITTMGLTVNGENLPGKPLQLKFGADSNYISAFQTLYAGAHKIFDNQGNGITREEYANGYTLFVFDLTPDLCLGDHVQPIKNGNVSIECRFGTPLETAINIMVLGEFQSLIEIDANRNVLCDFNNWR